MVKTNLQLKKIMSRLQPDRTGIVLADALPDAFSLNLWFIGIYS